MSDCDTTRHTVTVDEQFADQLLARYPAATSVPQALLMAAQDGVAFKQSFGSDLKTYVDATARESARDELTDAPIVADE